MTPPTIKLLFSRKKIIFRNIYQPFIVAKKHVFLLQVPKTYFFGATVLVITTIVIKTLLITTLVIIVLKDDSSHNSDKGDAGHERCSS